MFEIVTMAGYRRVNYYELCRLCTSSEGTKMHIFREEGRKRQLPTKIQICLPVQVCEDDSLPKIICSQCVEKLESFYDFRESCVNAETMLESYFTSFRYSDDFSREGKVYVKEENSPKKKSEGDITNKNNYKGTGMGASDGLSSLVQAAGIQIVSDADGTRVQQYKCAMQMQAGSSGNAVMETASASAEARYAYEACNASSPRMSEANRNATTTTSVEAHQAKLEDGSTQCNETDFKNNGMTRNQGSADSSDESELASNHNQQQLPSVAFAAGVPGQEMLLHFSFKQERDAVLRSEEQSALQRSSIAQIGEFLRMKSASIVDNGVQSPTMEVPQSDRHCLRCGKLFPSLEQLQCHPCHQDPLAESVLDKGTLGGGSISCDVCHKLFKRKEHLFQHRKLHTGERPYVCPSCGKSFSRKEHLVRHTVSHTGQKIHACEMCGKSFSRKDNLHKHRKTHGIAGPFICETCGKSFVVKHNYMMHKSSHSCSGSINDDIAAASLDNPLPYKCDICNKGFAMKQYLITHKQRHRSRGRVNAVTSGAVPEVPTISMANVATPQDISAAAASHQSMTSACESSLTLVSSGPSASGSTSGHNTERSSAHPRHNHHSEQPSQQQQDHQQPLPPQQQQQQDDRLQQRPEQQQEKQQQLQDTTQQAQEDSVQHSAHPQTSQPPQSTVQLDPLALTHATPLTNLPSSPLLAPGLLQHVNASGVSVSSANPTMAIHVSTAATAYLCTPPNDILETYRRLHST